MKCDGGVNLIIFLTGLVSSFQPKNDNVNTTNALNITRGNRFSPRTYFIFSYQLFLISVY